MPGICATYERVTGCPSISAALRRAAGVCRLLRQPSGRHRQGMAYRKEHGEHLDLLYPGGPPRHRPPMTPTSSALNNPERQGRHRLCAGTELQLQPAPKMRKLLATRSRACPNHSHTGAERHPVLHLRGHLPPCQAPQCHRGSTFAQVNSITATVTLDLNGQRKGGRLGGQRGRLTPWLTPSVLYRHGVPSGELLLGTARTRAPPRAASVGLTQGVAPSPGVPVLTWISSWPVSRHWWARSIIISKKAF